MVDVLLEENTLGQFSGSFEEDDSNEISQRITKLSIPHFLKGTHGFILWRVTVKNEFSEGRHAKKVRYSAMDNRLLLMAWSLPKEKYQTLPLGKKGILTVYQLSDPSTPYR